MNLTKLVITFGGKWVGNFYKGGETNFVKVRRNLTYVELSRVVQSVANVDLTRFTIELRTLVDIGVRLRSAQPKIKYDSDVKMLLCDDGHVPKVYVNVVEKVSVEPAWGSNNVLGSIPTTDHAFKISSVNPIIFEDPTINEVVAKSYNEDERSIPEYNPYSEYGLDHFDEAYIGHGGSREGVNDEPAHYHRMGSDPTDGGLIGPAIKVTMAKEHPEITHGLYGFHMNMNLKNRFKSHV
ncbi:hypothetical protein QYF36_002974 [Acer negundo]|nr:hypothetical protein QYF36_002974 [Acer negundo]